MKRMLFGLLAGLGIGYLMWTARGRELVERAKQQMGGGPQAVVDVTMVGTIPAEPASPGVENLRATS
jgi:hypothetical protein